METELRVEQGFSLAVGAATEMTCKPSMENERDFLISSDAVDCWRRWLETEGMPEYQRTNGNDGDKKKFFFLKMRLYVRLKTFFRPVFCHSFSFIIEWREFRSFSKLKWEFGALWIHGRTLFYLSPDDRKKRVWARLLSCVWQQQYFSAVYFWMTVATTQNSCCTDHPVSVD